VEVDVARMMHRLLLAMNAHDLDAFVACFAPDYVSEQPAHPSRAFQGIEQVRKNWEGVFAGVRDFTAELVLCSTADNGVEIGEWRWRGAHADGTPFAMDGVIVVGRRRRSDRVGPPLHGARRAGWPGHRRDGRGHLQAGSLTASRADMPVGAPGDL
jgi:ketosteroid isomerase-like protein